MDIRTNNILQCKIFCEYIVKYHITFVFIFIQRIPSIRLISAEFIGAANILT